MLKANQFKDEKEYKYYVPSEDETTKVNYVLTRFNDMQQARTAVDRNWDIYQTMIDATFVQYPDERSSSVVPLASSMIELYVAEANKLETQFNFRGETSESSTQAKALEYVWKYDWRQGNRKKAFLDNEYITAAFGFSVIQVGFDSRKKEQYDFEIMDDMKYDWKKVVIDKREIFVRNVDIRNFYLDNQAIHGIEDASDCSLIQWVSMEKFLNLKSNPLYKNIDVVHPRQYSNEYKTFITDEELIKQGDFVQLMHYWNVEKDAYMVLANGVLIREQPMMSTIAGEKALPFVIRNLGKKNYSIYGRGICESLMMFNSEINNLRELLMDGIRRSNTQVLALGNGLSFTDRGFSYNNEILEFEGNLQNNFQQLTGTPPNQAIFSYLERLYKDIAMFIGIDIQNILGEPNQTAFQTEVQREASQKRVNVWLMNRDIAYERFANLYKDLLQTYFPLKTVEGIYPKIEIEDEELRNGKFKKKKGKSIFEATPEILRGDILIDVYTNVSAPTISAVDREQKKEFLNDLGGMAQAYAMAEQAGFNLESVLPKKATIEALASDYNFQTTTSDTGGEDLAEKKQQFMAKLMQMKQSQQQQPMQAEQSMAQPQQQPLENNQPTEGLNM